MYIYHWSSYHRPRKSWSIYEISFSNWNENAAAIAWASCQRYWNSGMAFRTRVLFPSPFRSISSFSFPSRSPRSTGPERWKNNAYTTRTPFVSIEHGVSLHPCLLSFLASLVHRFWRRRRPLFFSSLQFYSGFLSFLATRSHRILLHAAAAAASRLVSSRTVSRVSCNGTMQLGDALWISLSRHPANTDANVVEMANLHRRDGWLRRRHHLCRNIVV